MSELGAIILATGPRGALPSRYGILAHAVISDAIHTAKRGCKHSRAWLADTAAEEVGTLRFWCSVLSIHLGVAVAPESVAGLARPTGRRVNATRNHKIGSDQRRNAPAKDGRGGYRYGKKR